MKKTTLLAIIVIFATLFFSCSNDKMSMEGKVNGEKYNGETVYLYMVVSSDLDTPTLLSTTTVVDGKFVFEEIDKNESFLVGEIPTLAFIALSDEIASLEDERLYPFATAILEQGKINVEFDDTAVILSGTPRNEKFNAIHLVITQTADLTRGLTDFRELDNLPASAEGKDGRAQYQDLELKFKSLTFEFVKENMQNNVGQFLFLKSYPDDMFTPTQMLGLITASSAEFQNEEEIKELKSILDTMNDGLPLEFSDFELDGSDYDEGE